MEIANALRVYRPFEKNVFSGSRTPLRNRATLVGGGMNWYLVSVHNTLIMIQFFPTTVLITIIDLTLSMVPHVDKRVTIVKFSC